MTRDCDGRFPRRLRRLNAVFSERPLFFLTVCTHRCRKLLANPVTHRLFLSFCSTSLTKASVWVGRYVLMPEHLHVFVCADGSPAVSRWVGSLKKFLGKRWRDSGMKGPFWQSGFFDHVLRSGESYSQKWEYVANNPVRAGLVADACEWPYGGEVHELWW